MALPSVCFTLLVILSNLLLESVEAQLTKVKTSSDVIESLVNLSKAMATLQTRMELQTITLSNLEAKADTQEALLNYLVTTAGIQANLLNNLETKIHVQAKSLSSLGVQSNIQINSLYKLEANLEVQATALNNFVTKEEWQEPIAQSPVNRTIEALEGDDVEIWCVVHGVPLPEIRWKRENGTLESDRMATANNGNFLRIKNVRLSDEGSYVCVAANGVGTSASQFVRLQVYGKYQQCNGLIESDKGNLEIEPSNSSCLSIIKLQKTTGFRLEWDPLMTEPILVIPEQSPSNYNVQSIQLGGSKTNYHQLEGKSLGIVVPPGRERTTLSWKGLDLDGSGVSSSTKLVKDKEGTLEWESRGDRADNVFWGFDHEFAEELNWTLNTDFAAHDQESPCENISFSVIQIRRDGNISEIQRTCDGSSEGSITLETSSQVLVLLRMKSVEATRSKLRVSWTHHDVPIKQNVDGIVAGTDTSVFVIPFSSMKSKPVPSGSPVNRIYGLTFDWNSQKIYFLKRNVGIIRSNLDGSESKILVSDSSATLYGITLEPTSGNLYYGIRTSRTIRVCNNVVTKCSTIVTSSDLSAVWDLAVHRSKGLLFWSISGKKVVRANLDGSNATVILQRNNVRGIDVDEQEDRLYWAFSGGVGSCDLSGQRIRELPNGSGRVFDVAIEKDKVYYGTWDTHAVHVILKSGTNSRLVANFTNDVNYIALFGTRASNNPPNPCHEANCAHLCVLVTRWSYRCTCPDAQVLNADGKTCTI